VRASLPHELSGPDDPDAGDSSAAAVAPVAPAANRGHLLRNTVVGALMLLVALSISLAFGWHGLASQQRERLPTRLLIELIRFEPRHDGPLAVELLRRISRGQLDDAEYLRALERCVLDARPAAPGSDVWARRTRRLIRVWQLPVGRPDVERSRLYAIPADVRITAPPVWPLDAPLALHVRVDDWWPVETVCRLRIEVEGMADPIVALRAAGAAGRRPIAVELPPPPSGATSVELRIHIERAAVEVSATQAVDGSGGGASSMANADGTESEHDWIAVQTSKHSVGVAGRVVLDAALLPLADSRLDDGMAEAFSTGLLRWRDGQDQVAIQFTPQAMTGRVADDFAVGAEIELQERGETRRRSRIWWLVADDRASNAEWDPPEEDLDAIRRLLSYDADDPRLDEWRIVVTSRRDLAFRAFGSSEATATAMTLPARFWTGRVELPLSVNDRTGRPPPRSWRRVP